MYKKHHYLLLLSLLLGGQHLLAQKAWVFQVSGYQGQFEEEGQSSSIYYDGDWQPKPGASVNIGYRVFMEKRVFIQPGLSLFSHRLTGQRINSFLGGVELDGSHMSLSVPIEIGYIFGKRSSKFYGQLSGGLHVGRTLWGKFDKAIYLGQEKQITYRRGFSGIATHLNLGYKLTPNTALEFGVSYAQTQFMTAQSTYKSNWYFRRMGINLGVIHSN